MKRTNIDFGTENSKDQGHMAQGLWIFEESTKDDVSPLSGHLKAQDDMIEFDQRSYD